MGRKAKPVEPSPADVVGSEVTAVVSYEEIQAALKATVDDLASEQSVEFRKQVLEQAPTVFDALVTLSRGLKVKEAGTDNIYFVPPHFPAIKYLADWARQIMGLDATKRTVHEISEDTKAMLKDYIQAKHNGPVPTFPTRDGVIEMVDER